MNSLRNRTFFIVFGASLLPILALWMLFSVVAKPKVKKELADQRLEAVEQLANLLERNTKDWLEQLETLAANPVLADATDQEARSKELRLLQRLKFEQLVLLDPNGYVVDSTSTKRLKIQEYAPAFMKAAKTGEIHISEPFVDRTKAEVMFPCYVPIKSKGEVINVIKVTTSFTPQTGPLNAFKTPQRGDVLLLDADGRVLHSQSSQSNKLKPFATEATNKLICLHKGGIFRQNGEEDKVFASTYVQPFGLDNHRSWHLLSLVPVSHANHGLREMDKDFSIVLLVAIICSAFVSVLLNNWFAKPLETLAAASSRAANGDFDAEIPMTGLREVDQSAEAFNLMLLRTSNQQGYLEQEVEDRMEQLNASLATLEASHNAIEDGLVIIDKDGLVTEANDSFCALFDVVRDDLLATDQLSTIFEQWIDKGQGTSDLLENLNTDSKTIIQEEWNQAEHAQRCMNVYSAPILKEGGAKAGRLWVFKDLTNYRELEDELRQSQKMEAIGTLAGGVAHDFNNLLTAISGNLNLVLPRIKADAEAAGMVETAINVSGRAAGLVKQLLSFSRKSQVNKEWCDLRMLADETEAILSHSLDPSISVKTDAPADLWSVDADHNQMQQILMNLCVNARDAIGKEGVITIELKNTTRRVKAAGVTKEEESEYVVVEVIDDGSGMSPEVKNNIFDPFFTTKEQGKGTGLGLSTCYGIATLHNGWMEVESEPGVGTTMRLVLPKGQCEQPIHLAAVDKPMEIRLIPSECTILIADDEPAVRGIAEILLKRSGFNVVTASDGLEAYQMVQDRKGGFDLILLDLTMPRMDGKEAFAGISKWYPEIPVMICSGYLCDFKDFETEEGNLPVGFIQKPYPLDEMTDRIGEAISEAKANRPVSTSAHHSNSETAVSASLNTAG